MIKIFNRGSYCPYCGIFILEGSEHNCNHGAVKFTKGWRFAPRVGGEGVPLDDAVDRTEERCGLCRFWLEHPVHEGQGKCRLNPATEQKFCSDWCGQFERV